MRNFLLACLVLALCPAGLVRAASSPQSADRKPAFDLYSRGPYRSDVPRPESILGYELGTRETTYWEQERVVRAIADAATDRVKVFPYGKTVEGRPLRIVAISSPENMARIETIRANALRLADPRSLPAAEATELARAMPAIVWLNQNVHGDESTSFESGMALIYNLAATQEPKLLESLKNCVVIVNPSFNPDGHERFAVYHNSIGMNDPNNDAIEHGQPWAIYGRYNHYRFDMNRDKLAVSQQEVRQEIAEYLRWNPHVYVDQHGEVDQYFFPPVALPINENADRAYQEKWLDRYGRGNAAAFDRNSWDYYTRGIFDFLYVGYLDAWAALNGAIGMTYETDGGGNLGFAWRRTDGTVITLRDGIAHHLVAAIATIETTSTHREERLRDFYAFRKAAVDEGRSKAMKHVVIVPSKDPERAATLVATLRRVGIEVGVASAAFSTVSAHNYGDGANAAGVQKRFDSGVYVVDLAQPQGRMARAFLEPDAKLNPEFVMEQLARRDRNDKRGKNTPQESAGFYDVTAWSLPLTFGVETYWLGDAPAISAEPLGTAVDPEHGRRAPFAPEGGVSGGRGQQAFVFPYGTNASARLALALLREGFRIGVSHYEMRAGGRTFPRGAIVVRTGRNHDSLGARIAQLARETGVQVTAVDSQYSDDVAVGVGSEEVQQLRTPRILVAAGDAVSQTSYGAIWYMLERELQYPFTAMDPEQIPYTDLRQFNVIILPDGYSGAYSDRIGAGGLEKLRQWVNDGGTLIAIGGATAYLVAKDSKMTSARAVGSSEDEGGKDDGAPAADDVSDAPKDAPKGKEMTAKESAGKDATPKDEDKKSFPPVKPVPATPLYVPGAVFRADVDHNYFMSFGYEEKSLFVPVNTDLFLRPSKDGANVVGFPKNAKVVSGFIWPKNTEQLLAGTSYVVDEPTGGGHVILFTEDVTFRRLWRGLDRLLINGFLFGPGHSSGTPGY
ncbi:MAG: M14 family metallopeptidase [Blastocatellia bacterium]